MIIDEIKNTSIKQGDLVFILHTEKPMKTGWYRKVRLSNESPDTMIMVFEKAIHPKFSEYDKSLEFAHRTKGVFHMTERTFTTTVYSNPYVTLAIATGVTATQIVQNNYRITCDTPDLGQLNDLTITEEGEYFLTKLNIIEKNYYSTHAMDKYLRAFQDEVNFY